MSAATWNCCRMLNLCAHSRPCKCPKKEKNYPQQKPHRRSQSQNPNIHYGHHIYFQKQWLLYQHKGQISGGMQYISPCMSGAEYWIWHLLFSTCVSSLLVRLSSATEWWIHCFLSLTRASFIMMFKHHTVPVFLHAFSDLVEKVCCRRLCVRSWHLCCSAFLCCCGNLQLTKLDSQLWVEQPF